MSGKVSNVNQRFVNSCLANSPSVYIYTVKRSHLITSPALNECLLVHNLQNNCSTECHCVTQKSIEVRLHNKCHKIYPSSPFGIFCLYVILTISYLRVQTIETSSLPTDSLRPLSKQIIYIYIYHLTTSVTDIVASSSPKIKALLLGNIKIKIQ